MAALGALAPGGEGGGVAGAVDVGRFCGAACDFVGEPLAAPFGVYPNLVS